MNPEDWRRVERIFERAAGLTPDRQAALLDATCGHEPTVRREVERLLHADHASGDFLEHAVGSGIELFYGAGSDGEHRRIGPYRLLERLGHGGMGEVFLADRADREYQKKVAIKLVRLAGDRRILERFRRERQILASLEHPNIAHLLDGGTTREGVPYLVMEYIEGEPIDRYCDKRRLGIRARLALFGAVCDAVQFAHQNLVVHRDLKPSNIFVTADGTVKLLDFGIAKLLDPKGTSGVDPDFTLTAERPLTLSYASPEQVLGEPITAASDVYALGCLLYVLLTGQRPFVLGGLPRRDAERIILEQAPVLPSRRVTTLDVDATLPAVPGAGTDTTTTPEAVASARGTRPDALRRRLAGDLDTMVAMALRKASRRRYGTAAGLGSDVARYLAGRPVRAHRDSVGYRTAKFMRRNRLALTLAAVVLLALTFAWIDRTRQATALRRQAVDLLEERDNSDRLVAFLKEVFVTNDPRESRGLNVTARELLESSVGRLQTELAGQPLALASLSTTIGSIYRELGLYDRSAPLLEQGLSLRREHLGDDHPVVAESLDEHGLLLWRQGREGEAESSLRAALAIFDRQRPARPRDVARVSNNLALSLMAAESLPEAEGLLRRSLTLYEGHGDAVHRPPVLNNLGNVLRARGDLAGARALHDQALKLSLREFNQPDPRIAQYLNNLGVDLHSLGQFEEADRRYAEALDMRRTVLGDDHPDLIETMANRAELARAQGHLTVAEERAHAAIAFGRANPEVTPVRLAEPLNTLGLTLKFQGRFADAEAPLREAMMRYLEAYGPTSSRSAAGMISLGLVLLDLGKLDEAGERLAAALAIVTGNHPAGPHDFVARAHGALGLLAQLRDRPDLAIGHHEVALHMRIAIHGEQRRLVAATRARLASALAEGGLFDLAAHAYREAIGFQRCGLPPDHSDLATSLAGLGSVLTAQGAFDEADAVLRDAIRIRTLRYGPDGLRVAEARGLLGALLAARGDRIAARPLLREAEQALAAFWGEDHPRTQRARARRVRVG